MDSEGIKRAIDVMQHYANGGRVQSRVKGSSYAWQWCPCPRWNFCEYEYRIKPQPVKRWVNVYPNDTFGKPCKDRAECDLLAKRVTCSKRIACIQIEYTPGEGLEGECNG